ncbi:hypothetical protein J8273_8709 [Carpediemonas membranifera]|uniref:Uncharacterized protein n=1 Tax=Carpediemonas membranifera TaxID=201153 RepID=A0A8J6APJ7_9EUKA|nr:hypothetical protein J8273_8709 [Carpediemonas membranifera]|eukprot:KAG9390016.1 hypothetical protein J8273_8709 [Carpediemonas membranifera]
MSSGAKDSAGYASMMFEALLRMIPKLQEYIARYRGDGGEMDPAMLLQAILHRVPDLHHADKRHIRELLAARNSICHNRDVSSADDFASFEMSVTCVMSFVTQKVGRDDGFNAFMEALHNEANGGPTRTRVHEFIQQDASADAYMDGMRGTVASRTTVHSVGASRWQLSAQLRLATAGLHVFALGWGSGLPRGIQAPVETAIRQEVMTHDGAGGQSEAKPVSHPKWFISGSVCVPSQQNHCLHLCHASTHESHS